MSASRIKAFDRSCRLIAVMAILLALVATATATPTPTPIAGPVSDNSAGTGPVAASTIPGTVEPAASDTHGLFLISIVAIQGIGATNSTGASSAFLCLPGTPGPWISIGDWSCDGGESDQIHVAAAYRFTTASDAPGEPFTWSFSSTPCGSPTAETFKASVINTLYSNINTTPFDGVEATPTCNLGTAGSAVVSPAITTTKDNDLIVGVFDAAGFGQSLILPASGSDLGPLVSQSNSGQGPDNFTAFANTADIGTFNHGEFGAAGVYGPFTATQAAAGESLGLTLGMVTPPPQAIVSGAPIRISRAPGSTVDGGTFQVCDISGGQMTTSSVTISFDNADLFTSATLTGTEGANTVTATLNPVTGGNSPEQPNNTIFNFSPLIIPPGACASFNLSVTITSTPDISMRRAPMVYASLFGAVSEPGSNSLGVLLGAMALLSLCAAAVGGARRRRTTIAVILFLASLATQIGCDTGGLPASLSSSAEKPQSTQTVVKVAVATQNGAPVPVSGLPVKISTVLTQP